MSLLEWAAAILVSGILGFAFLILIVAGFLASFKWREEER